MAYGKNAPFGLRVIGHLSGGADDIRINSNYIISGNSPTLNEGDPVMFAPQNAQYAVNDKYKGGQGEIMLYKPVPAFGAAGAATRTTLAPENGIAGQPMIGVFNGCEYIDMDGKQVYKNYWIPGTMTKSVVTAYVYDDPGIIYDIQLGTYFGSSRADNTRFLTLPCLQIQDATWPHTGGAVVNPTIANSCIIGSNISLMTGRGPLGGVGSGTDTLATITLNGVVMNYPENPLIANYGTAGGPRYGTSTFYACPSLAVTDANPGAVDGRNEYDRGLVTTDLKVQGFTQKEQNVPGVYGQPGMGVAGNYFNTPFLNILVTINNHAFKAGTKSLTVA